MNKKTKKKFVLSKMKAVSITYLIVMYAVIIISSTYAYQEFVIANHDSTGTAGCTNFIVSYTGQNLTAESINTSDDYTEGAKATVTLSKNSSCKLFTEANIYINTSTSTTAPIATTQALKYVVKKEYDQISTGTISAKNDLLVATVPLTDTPTTYTVYLYIDPSLSGGEYTGTTYSGYVHATSTQTSTIEGNYLVTFNANNNTNLSLSKTVTKGQPYGWLPTPTKEGYTFTGWKLSSTNITSTTNVTQSAAHTLVAQWTPATYTVSFNANGGSVGTTSKTVTYGSTYGTLPTPTYPGKTFKGWSILPNYYKQVEFIQSSGTQYINSNYKPSATTGIKARYQFTTTTTQQRIFGVHGSSSVSNSLTYTYYINGSSKMAYGFKNGEGNWAATSLSADTSEHNLNFNVEKDYYQIDNLTKTAISSTTRTNTALYDMLILATTNGSSVTNQASAKLYEFNIYESGKIVKQLTPCISPGGEKGLCDLVKNDFYPNSGTGTFTTGSNVYVTNTTTVAQEKDHTLTAVWE